MTISAPTSLSGPAEVPTVLVVDDDASITASVALTLKQHGYRCIEAAGPEEALGRLDGAEGIDLVLQDMNFSRATSGEEGLALLAEIRRRSKVPVILMTAWGTIDLAVLGMGAGASDFLTKPWSRDRLLGAIDTALELARAHASAATSPARADLDARFDFRGIVGEDRAMLRLLDLVGRVAPTEASVLVTGESGTGKEGLAEAIHRNSRRSAGPFVKVNLGGISPSLFESEMFGHVRGAFTDARKDRVGRFELADGGTIFLDEIGELDPAAQVKLLRVLQDRTYEVLGSSHSRKVDVRVVAATNRDLDEMVAKGSFREDLLYRLNLISLELPPLRHRRGDVPLLARHFLVRSARLYGREGTALAEPALDWLASRTWPGNIRQLEQTIERAVLLGDGPEIGVSALTQLEDGGAGAPAGAATNHGTASTPADLLPPPGVLTLDAMEKLMIEKTLSHHRGNLTRSARDLGLSRAALYRRLDKHGLSPGTADTANSLGGAVENDD